MLFWCGAIAARHEEIQKRGIVYIMFAVNVRRLERDASKRFPYLIKTCPCMPARVAALHVCSDDKQIISHTCKMATHYFDSDSLCRFQTHFGGHLECRNNLMTFGIPVSAMPIREDGSIDLAAQKA
jgi:hypothetical protein